MRISKIFTAAALAALLCGLAPQAALADRKSDADEILDHIERLLFDVEHAQKIVNDRPHHHRDEYYRAQELLRLREAELERARIDAMSAATGVPRGRIISMRAHGRSWEGIALDLDVNPRVVGLPGPAWYPGDGPWAGHRHYRRWYGEPHWKGHDNWRGDRDHRYDRYDRRHGHGGRG